METVIAVGIVAILLSSFIVIFGPTAKGIRGSISTQLADGLASALERDLVTLRDQENGDQVGSQNVKTGFDKGFHLLKDSDKDDSAILVYQYRGQMASSRADGTAEPWDQKLDQKVSVGVDYSLFSIVRRVDEFTAGNVDMENEMNAIDGPIFLVKLNQLIFDANNNGLIAGTPGKVQFQDENGAYKDASQPADYSDAVIAISADFYQLPSTSVGYLSSPEYRKFFVKPGLPAFSRNLAIRR